MQKFSIKQWSAWDLTDSGELADYRNTYSGQPALSGVKSMVKRRMPPMAKAIHELSKDDSPMPIIYASKNAELSKTIKIIRQFGGDISPAMFSMSVHNAIPGLLSVVGHDDSLYSVIDSMSGVVEMAVLEALSLLTAHQSVKVVYFEEPILSEFSDKNLDPNLGVVLKLIVKAGNEMTLHCEPNESNKPSSQSHAVIKGFLAFLQGDLDNISHNYVRNSWLWQRC